LGIQGWWNKIQELKGMAQKIQFVVVYCTSQTINFDEPFSG
jgi:ABC-type uncharacterized transport system ATPase subunit